MIELRDITVRFSRPDGGQSEVLSKFNLTVAEGEFVLLAGANGAGKSTLLNLVAGSLKPTEGAILLNGQDVTALSASKRSRVVARVFQNPYQSTAGALTVAENLRLAELRAGHRWLSFGLRGASRERFREALAVCQLGLEECLDRPTSTLSGGQRQAVAVVMASLVKPKVLLLDEHTAALSPVAAATVMGLTERLVRDHRITTLMVTHNPDHLAHFGDRTVVVGAG